MTGQSVREVVIEEIGHRGDGIGEGIFIPGTVPGDRVRVSIFCGHGRVLELVEPGAGRAEPVCPHYSLCGGCALQHIDEATYRLWKTDQVKHALASRGFTDLPLETMIAIPPGTRRRVSLGTRMNGGERVLGFRERSSNRIVHVEECPVARPEIVAALQGLKVLMAAGLSEGGAAEVQVTVTEAGLDVAVWPQGGGALEPWRREALANEAMMLSLARFTWGGEVVAERSRPFVLMSGVRVEPPPGAFLQPSSEGEAALARLVTRAVGDAGKTADLFAGCGTFTFALARRVPVHAVEADGEQLAALEAAARSEQGLKPITVERRDLTRRQLVVSELKLYKAAVLNPPRTGARVQIAEVARADLAKVVIVSCNPATFARDARTLVDGGYTFEQLTPVDQFVWSADIELVGVFSKR
ncbi:MAG: class I SAM-dependent RNA methyltransferase [Alphaproteobacteria bacterium]|nr:class I SAM-dependent RNA methyltransferase [Alphaproteobacteria bacterium]